jgi:hypothetical protein
MNLHKRLGALFVILALVGCAQVATGTGAVCSLFAWGRGGYAQRR